MAPNITQLTRSDLKNLKKSQHISVIYKESPTGTAQVIASAFPKAIATTFSPKWAKEFPDIKKMTLKPDEKITAQKNSVMVIGGKKQGYQKIISWMVSCCDGNGLRHFEKYAFHDKPFTGYYNLYQCAKEIGCEYLEKEFDKRMTYFIETQVHSEDIREMFLHLPRDNPLLPVLGKHIATHLFQRTLKTPGPYFTLREEIYAFDEEVNKAIEPMIEARREQNKTEAGERRAEAARRREDNKQRRNSHFRPNDLKVDGKGVIHVQKSLPIVRTSNSGKSWAKLDLAEAGIDKNDFTGRPYQGTKSRRPPPVRNNAKEQKGKKNGQAKEDQEAQKGEKKSQSQNGQSQGSKGAKKDAEAVDRERQKKKKAGDEFKEESVKHDEEPEGRNEGTVSALTRKGSVPGADSINSKNKNARRRARNRRQASAASTELSKNTFEATTESTIERSQSWADEMSKASSAA